MNNKYLNSKLKAEYKNDYSSIIKGYSEDRYLTLRVNTLKSSKEEIIKVFDENGIKYENVSFYKDAFIITNKKESDLEELDIYKDGKIYFQSLSSMIPPLVLEPKEGENILDMTAAPGSKTSQIAALSNNMALITAVEKDKIRYERLKYNLDKLGTKKINILNIDAMNLDDSLKFDKILLDAPCTGVGTISIDDSVTLNEEYLNKMVNRQVKLIKKAIELLRKDGILIYSTCSILKEENEEVLKKVLSDNIILESISVDLEKLDSDYNEVLTVMPSKCYEGFFVAKIKKMF